VARELAAVDELSYESGEPIDFRYLWQRNAPNNKAIIDALALMEDTLHSLPR
jgi:hypothetical protein